jgi:hypothetical protein
MISPTKNFLLDNTQQSQESDIHTPVGFELTIPSSERPQTRVFDGAATGIGQRLTPVRNI